MKAGPVQQWHVLDPELGAPLHTLQTHFKEGNSSLHIVSRSKCDAVWCVCVDIDKQVPSYYLFRPAEAPGVHCTLVGLLLLTASVLLCSLHLCYCCARCICATAVDCICTTVRAAFVLLCSLHLLLCYCAHCICATVFTAFVLLCSLHLCYCAH